MTQNDYDRFFSQAFPSVQKLIDKNNRNDIIIHTILGMYHRGEISEDHALRRIKHFNDQNMKAIRFVIEMKLGN